MMMMLIMIVMALMTAMITTSSGGGDGSSSSSSRNTIIGVTRKLSHSQRRAVTKLSRHAVNELVIVIVTKE
jgi:hypothetical protein